MSDKHTDHPISS